MQCGFTFVPFLTEDSSATTILRMVENTKRVTLPSEALTTPPDTRASRSTVTGRFRHAYHSLLAGALLAVLPAAVRAEEVPETITPESSQTASAGSLLIAGGGDLPKEIQIRFLELAGGKNARIVVIPTASETADEPEQNIGTYWKGDKENVASIELLHTRSREDANNPVFVKPLDRATGVWFSGGRQSQLASVYRDTLMEDGFRSVLRRNGVVGGTSAGAAVISECMIAHGNPIAVMDKGFRLLPRQFVVDQHFKARGRFSRLQGALEPEQTGFGIDEGTALIVRGNIATVLGEKSVWICKPQGEPEGIQSGKTVDLRAHGMSDIADETGKK